MNYRRSVRGLWVGIDVAPSYITHPPATGSFGPILLSASMPLAVVLDFTDPITKTQPTETKT